MNRRSNRLHAAIEGLEKRETPSSLIVNPGTIRGFNPQPDPPAKILIPAEIRSFDPQPDPFRP